MSAATATATDENEPPARQERPLSNFDRLRGHLAKGSLAAQLLAAYVNPREVGQLAAMQSVVAARLEALRRQHDEPADPQA